MTACRMPPSSLSANSAAAHFDTWGRSLANQEQWIALDALSEHAPMNIQRTWVQRYGAQRLPGAARRADTAQQP